MKALLLIKPIQTDVERYTWRRHTAQKVTGLQGINLI